MISVGMLAKIRRMHLRDGMSIREVCRRTGLSRNTVRNWLRQDGVTEPKYPKRASGSAVDAFGEQLETALRADAQRPARDRRTARALFEQIRAKGYRGSYRASRHLAITKPSRMPRISSTPASRWVCRRHRA